MSSSSESATMETSDLAVGSPVAGLATAAAATSDGASAPVPGASSTPITAKKVKGKSEPKKRKLGNEVSTDISEELIQLEKTIEFYRNECAELVAKIDSMEIKAINQEADYLRRIAKKDEQVKTQDELMTKGKDEILRLRAAVVELEA